MIKHYSIFSHLHSSLHSYARIHRHTQLSSDARKTNDHVLWRSLPTTCTTLRFAIFSRVSPSIQTIATFSPTSLDHGKRISLSLFLSFRKESGARGAGNSVETMRREKNEGRENRAKDRTLFSFCIQHFSLQFAQFVLHRLLIYQYLACAQAYNDLIPWKYERGTCFSTFVLSLFFIFITLDIRDTFEWQYEDDIGWWKVKVISQVCPLEMRSFHAQVNSSKSEAGYIRPKCGSTIICIWQVIDPNSICDERHIY